MIMEENTQLPVEVVEEIKKAAAFYSGYQAGEDNSPYRSGTFMGYNKGAIEYAAKLHETQQENEQLRRWKMEAAELLTKIHSYAHKHLEIKLGQCAVEFVIGRAKERDEMKLENEKLKKTATGWRPLLEEAISKHESGLLPDRFIYEKIKTFLYGE